MPLTVTEDVHYLEYTPSFYCVILAWQEIINFLLDTHI